jgi:hypothetical protein
MIPRCALFTKNVVARPDLTTLYARFVNLKPAACHLLDSGNAIAVNFFENKSEGQGGELTAERKRFEQFNCEVELVHGWSTEFLSFRGQGYFVWIPLLNKDDSKAKFIIFSCRHVNEWNSAEIFISFRKNHTTELSSLTDIIFSWFSDMLDSPIDNEIVIRSGDMTVIEDGILVPITANKPLQFSLIELYLRCRRLKLRPRIIAVSDPGENSYQKRVQNGKDLAEKLLERKKIREENRKIGKPGTDG